MRKVQLVYFYCLYQQEVYYYLPTRKRIIIFKLLVLHQFPFSEWLPQHKWYRMQGPTLWAEILPVLFKQMALISSCWILEGAVDVSDTSSVLPANHDFTAVICIYEIQPELWERHQNPRLRCLKCEEKTCRYIFRSGLQKINLIRGQCSCLVTTDSCGGSHCLTSC